MNTPLNIEQLAAQAVSNANLSPEDQAIHNKAFAEGAKAVEAELTPQIEALEAELATLKAQSCFYVTTYRDNVNGTFISEKDADAYSDKFGGVYGVESVHMESAYNALNK